MSIRFLPLPTETATAYWNGATDAYGMAPERHVSDGTGVPCRHCLRLVGAGEPYLILALCGDRADLPACRTLRGARTV